ncbi:hypothetical protein SAMN02787118_114308 [Streptomyces mirabilis]|uniref:Uncharacterized protein n=1 Tax=Streptomyces mirabilis TaxID=68239 RepID=A0A1I2NBH3_9ACTN|nr:hypothetical protein SAMN02787118_114308 [Streptomyces mirabilis]
MAGAVASIAAWPAGVATMNAFFGGGRAGLGIWLTHQMSGLV